MNSLIDTGFVYARDNKRIFFNSSLGCAGGCKYCYLPNEGYDNNGKRIVKSIKGILDEFYSRNINITKDTLITIGCFSECWDKVNKSKTMKFLKHFLTKGNQVQLSTKKKISYREMKKIRSLIKYNGQLVIFVSSTALTCRSIIEPNTDATYKRIETIKNANKLNIPVVLYIKPVLQDITIKDLDKYKRIIKKYNIKDVVIGSIFTKKKSNESVHFSNKNSLFYNSVDDEEKIINELKNCCNIYTRSSEVMQKYVFR